MMIKFFSFFLFFFFSCTSKTNTEVITEETPEIHTSEFRYYLISEGNIIDSILYEDILRYEIYNYPKKIHRVVLNPNVTKRFQNKFLIEGKSVIDCYYEKDKIFSSTHLNNYTSGSMILSEIKFFFFKDCGKPSLINRAESYYPDTLPNYPVRNSTYQKGYLGDTIRIMSNVKCFSLIFRYVSEESYLSGYNYYSDSKIDSSDIGYVKMNNESYMRRLKDKLVNIEAE